MALGRDYLWLYSYDDADVSPCICIGDYAFTHIQRTRVQIGGQKIDMYRQGSGILESCTTRKAKLS
jgi:hypothetical protein